MVTKNSEFEDIFYLTISALYLNGSHPFIKRDIKWLLKFLITFGNYTSISCIPIFSILFNGLKSNDFSQTCKDFVSSVMFAHVALQYGALLCHQKTFVKLLTSMKTDFDMSKTFSEEERNIVFDYAMKGRYVCWQWFAISVLGVFCFTGKSIILMMYYYCIGEFHYIPIYEVVFPAFIENRRDDNIFVFLFTYFEVMYCGIYACVTYVAAVPLGPILMVHACGQLELMRKRVENLFGSRSGDEVEEKLKMIVKHHQYIKSFVDMINKSFTTNYEVTLKGITFLVPVTLYAILSSLAQDQVSLEFIAFIFGGICFQSTSCYYGNMLMDKGEELSLSLYSCGWELYYHRGARKTLIVMMEYAKRPIAIRTIFSFLCLDALTDLLRQSYALFGLMNAMWN